MNGRRKKTTRNRDSGQAADLERLAGNEPMAADACTAFSARVGISVHPFRCRPCDTDGTSCKAVLDALVHLGVIRDDSAKEVAWVHYAACQKVKNEDEEKTVIVIEEI